MSAAKTATSAGGSLEAPNQLFAAQTGLDKGFSARVTDNASINSLELNMVFHNYERIARSMALRQRCLLANERLVSFGGSGPTSTFLPTLVQHVCRTSSTPNAEPVLSLLYLLILFSSVLSISGVLLPACPSDRLHHNSRADKDFEQVVFVPAC